MYKKTNKTNKIEDIHKTTIPIRIAAIESYKHLQQAKTTIIMSIIFIFITILLTAISTTIGLAGALIFILVYAYFLNKTNNEINRLKNKYDIK